MQRRRGRITLWRLAVAALLLVALGVAGCGNNDDDDSGGGGSLKEGDTFTIGYAASKTGRLAVFEEPFANGLEAQVNEINRNGGIDGKAKIKLVVSDAKSDPSTGATVAQELIDGGAQFLITACDADASLPAAQVAQKAKVPTISSCGSGASLPQQVGEFSFLTVYGTEVMGEAMGEFAADEGWKAGALMRSKAIEYTDAIPAAAQKAYEAKGGEIKTTVDYELDQPRYTTQATEIAGADPQVVITPIFLTGSVTFNKNLRAAGYKGPIVTGDGQEGSETFSAGSAAENLYVTTYGYASGDAEGQALEQFNALYEKEHGEAPGSIIAALGADDAIAIAQAVTTAKSTDPVKVRDAFANLVDVQGATSKITYKDGKGLPSRDVVILKSEPAKKQFTFVKRFRPSSLQQAQ